MCHKWELPFGASKKQAANDTHTFTFETKGAVGLDSAKRAPVAAGLKAVAPLQTADDSSATGCISAPAARRSRVAGLPPQPAQERRGPGAPGSRPMNGSLLLEICIFRDMLHLFKQGKAGL